MGSRNRSRATFEKRQRELARQERQAEKRARRQGRTEVGNEPYRQDLNLSESTSTTDAQ